MGKKKIAFSVLLGLVITLATSLVVNTRVLGEFPEIRFVTIPIVGVSYWGLPLPWMKQIVYPGAPKEIIWSHFIIDALFWIAIVFVVKLFCIKTKRKKITRAKIRPKRKTRSTKRKARRRARR